MKYLILTEFLFITAILAACNPVSEDVPDKLWSSLHPLKPFRSSFYHGADYRFPQGRCDVVQCHGSDLTGGNSGAPSCYMCHGDIWTIFSTTHTLSRGGFYHDYHVDNAADTTSNQTWFDFCKTCHGSALDGSAGTGYSCRICHSGFTGSVPPPGHSSGREGQWHKPGSSCGGTACHGTGSGDNYTGGSASSYTGITWLAGHGPACSSCHD